MSSLPNSTNLSLTPGRRHRHRRSAAISGDFDQIGLGLFSPNANTNAHLESSPNKRVISGEKEYDYNNKEDDLDRHFNFNNEDDFCKKPSETSFSFPNRTPDLTQGNPRSFACFTSPPRRQNNYSLNSPIRLNHARSVSTSATPKTKFFLTEETNFNKENVPDAVIDLDEILKANTYSSETPSPSISIHKRTQLTPPELSGHDEFLASPFLKPNSISFISSPLSSSHNALFQQPIKEQCDTDNIDDIDELDEFDEVDGSNNDNIDLMADNEEDFFTNPQHTIGALYSNSSANSSASSLRSTKPIEKTLSNSSNNSGVSTSIKDVLPQAKRSGAKAHRYQSFYDQSFKVSNALKISSSESINLTRSNSITIRIANTPPNKDIRSLGHSSSLPSLKSNPTKRMGSKSSRLGETRLSDSKHIQPESKILLPSVISQLDKSAGLMTAGGKNDLTKEPKSIENQLFVGKNDSNSPASINSNYTSLSINGTIPSTEHSSVLSQNELNLKNYVSPNTPSTATARVPNAQSGESIQTKPTSVPDNSNLSNSSILSNTSDSSNNTDGTARSKYTNYKTPAIVVSPHNSSSRSTNSTFKIEVEPQNPISSQPISISSTGNSSPRQLSPKEQAFLRGTEIPPFRKSSSTSPKKDKHSSKLNVTVDELELRLSKNGISDTMSLKQKKKNKFITWLKRK